jgi:CubicO group peptidase (beta-lactamase class C family)
MDSNFIENGPFGSPVRVFAKIHKIGNNSEVNRGMNGSDPNSSKINDDTIFGEGSVGKIRFAGLSYMLQDEGKLNLQDKVTDFFKQQGVQQFLKRKYPNDPQLQNKILNLFSREDNKNATLSDLLTHYSGVGDNTKGNFETIQTEEIDANWSLSKQLNGIRKNKDGQILAMGPPDREILAEYNKHQYSNLGYILFGAVIESAVNKNSTDATQDKTYQDVMRDMMLNPVEGRAKGKIKFERTCFPDDLKNKKNIAIAEYVNHKGKPVSTSKFQAAGSAGGMFASPNDSVKFFTEFFRGFPGTTEFESRIKNSNKFLSDKAILEMTNEWKKYEPAGFSEEGNARYQGPGFVVEVEGKDKNKIISYEKNGETLGFKANMIFYPSTNMVDISMQASEDVTIHKSRNTSLDILPENLIAKMSQISIPKEEKSSNDSNNEVNSNKNFIDDLKQRIDKGATRNNF